MHGPSPAQQNIPPTVSPEYLMDHMNYSNIVKPYPKELTFAGTGLLIVYIYSWPVLTELSRVFLHSCPQLQLRDPNHPESTSAYSLDGAVLTPYATSHTPASCQVLQSPRG